MPLIHRIRAAKVAELRDLAARACEDTYRPGYELGLFGSDAWRWCVDALPDTATRAYCAAVHPDLLLALLDEIEQLRKEVHRGRTA